VLVVASMVLAAAATMAAISTFTLRTSLIDELDSKLTHASDRARNAPDAYAPNNYSPGAVADGSATTRPTPGPIPTSGPQPTDPPTAMPTAIPTAGDTGTVKPPPGALLLGQASATINVFGPVGSTPRAGWIDDTGTFQTLDDAQLAALLAIPRDGVVYQTDLPGLGTYRAIAVTDASGTLMATAVPTAPIDATVGRYLAAELAIALLVMASAVVVGRLLVRRALRPLDRVAATASTVSDLQLDRGTVVLASRVPDADTDPATEVGRVALALNKMLDHVSAALAAREASESQVRAFVADASHELRTPLASIRGYTELVSRTHPDLPPEVQQSLARVESQAQRMSSLVDDLLLLARLDAGRDIELGEVDMAAMIVDASSDAHATWRDHIWRINLDDDPAACLVTGDEQRLRQVVTNLLTNASVHTPAGTTVTVGIAVVESKVQLTVHDDGPGVPDEVRGRLFERFARADTSRSRQAGSTGLGLAIVHAVVTAHRGTVVVDSEPGSTTFTVELPISPAAQ